MLFRIVLLSWLAVDLVTGRPIPTSVSSVTRPNGPSSPHERQERQLRLQEHQLASHSAHSAASVVSSHGSCSHNQSLCPADQAKYAALMVAAMRDTGNSADAHRRTAPSAQMLPSSSHRQPVVSSANAPVSGSPGAGPSGLTPGKKRPFPSTGQSPWSNTAGAGSSSAGLGQKRPMHDAARPSFQRLSGAMAGAGGSAPIPVGYTNQPRPPSSSLGPDGRGMATAYAVRPPTRGPPRPANSSNAGDKFRKLNHQDIREAALAQRAAQNKAKGKQQQQQQPPHQGRR